MIFVCHTFEVVTSKSSAVTERPRDASLKIVLSHSVPNFDNFGVSVDL